MAKKVLSIRSFNGGIAPSLKEGVKGSFQFAQALDIFTEPSNASIATASVKRSGSTVDSLVKWIVSGSPYDSNIYFYALNGKIFKEDSGGTWSSIRTVSGSVGNGMELYNDYIYYTQSNGQIGRYGPLSGSPAFTDNWQTGLTATTDFAPIKSFKEGFVTGHGSKVAWYDGVTFTAARLTLPPGLKVRSLEVIGEFVVIGTWRGTNIYDNNEGYIFFWDGISTTFNRFVPIADGGCNALVTRQNQLYSVVGSQGYLLKNYEPFSKLERMPLLERTKYVEVYPGAVSTWQNLVCVGYAASTNSATIRQGVYLYGSIDDSYPEVINFSFPVSTGTTQSTTLQIGAVKGIGNNLYISWGDNSSYGVDRVSVGGNPYSSGTYTSLIYDDERAFADKQVITVKAQHLPLATGESVQLGYRVNRTGSITYGTAHTYSVSDPLPTTTRLEVPSDLSYHKELEISFILSQSNNTTPTITWFGAEIDDMGQENNF